VTRESIGTTISATHPIQVEVPLCAECQAVRRARRRKAVLIGLATGAAPGILAATLGSVVLPIEDIILIAAIAVPVGLFVGLIVGLIARDRAEPVRFKDHSAMAGTVLMRLRPTAGTSAFHRAIGVADERELVEFGLSGVRP
jgi:hypothetical protein